MKVYYYNLSVGSGIERIGDIIGSMMDGLHVKEYKLQNPAFIMIDDLVKERPDVIVINEAFPRVLEACYYYKRANPDVKVILINHCFSYLTSQYSQRTSDKDRDFLARKFLREDVNHIINLSVKPGAVKFSRDLDKKIIQLYPPAYSMFRVERPFRDREKLFVYIGNVLPHKLSLDFIRKIRNTTLTINVYGRVFRDKVKLKGYYEELFSCPNITYMGYCPEEKLVDVMNSYKYLVVPHRGYEPMMIVLGEFIQCGGIPLLVNSRDYPMHEWSDYAREFIHEFGSVDDLISYMEKCPRPEALDKDPSMYSRRYKEKYSYQKFREELRSLIGVKETVRDTRAIERVRYILSFKQDLARTFGKRASEVERAAGIVASTRYTAEDTELMKRVSELFLERALDSPITPFLQDLTVALGDLIIAWNNEGPRSPEIARNILRAIRTVRGAKSLNDLIMEARRLLRRIRDTSRYSPPAFEISRHYLEALRADKDECKRKE